MIKFQHDMKCVKRKFNPISTHTPRFGASIIWSNEFEGGNNDFFYSEGAHDLHACLPLFSMASNKC